MHLRCASCTTSNHINHECTQHYWITQRKGYYMKPPQNLTHSATRDRAAAGRRVHMRAALSQPRALPLSAGRHHVSPARACLDEAIARHELRQARRKASEAARAAIVSGRAPAFEETRRRLLAAGRAADKRLREALDNTRREMILRDGDAPKVRPDGGPIPQKRTIVLPRTAWKPIPSMPVHGTPPPRQAAAPSNHGVPPSNHGIPPRGRV